MSVSIPIFIAKRNFIKTNITFCNIFFGTRLCEIIFMKIGLPCSFSFIAWAWNSSIKFTILQKQNFATKNHEICGTLLSTRNSVNWIEQKRWILYFNVWVWIPTINFVKFARSAPSFISSSFILNTAWCQFYRDGNSSREISLKLVQSKCNISQKVLIKVHLSNLSSTNLA